MSGPGRVQSDAERLAHARALLAKGDTPCNKGNGAAYMTCGLTREHEPPCVPREGRVLTPPKDHNERHQALMEVWHSGSGLMRHRYRRCPQSGAGNCCCGRDDRSPLHKEDL